jgi:spermidine synthase
MNVIDRVETPRGELVLRCDDEHYEVISNGTFLMDTRNGESERLLVRAALDAHPHPATVVIAGLGVGFSLAEALRDDRVEQAVVVEIEPTLVHWHHTHLAAISGGALEDPRTELVVGDVLDHLASAVEPADVICLDIDNGPQWTVTAANAELYTDAGTSLVASKLRPDGVVSVWSAARSAAYEALLGRHFRAVDTHEIAVPRGDPDIVVVGRSPRSV